jgi:hypothetical protein
VISRVSGRTGRPVAKLVGLSILVAACRASSSRTPPAPMPPCARPAVDVASWTRIARPRFAFRIPPGFRQVPVQGIDSYVQQFDADGGDAMISLDLGAYSNDLQPDSVFYSSYARCSDVIGGHPATIITAIVRNPQDRRQDGRYAAAATWRNLTGVPDTLRQTHLTIWTETRDPRRLAELLATLRSVELYRR